LKDKDMIKAAMQNTAQEVENLIKELLPESEFAENKLFEAMRYSVLNGGKRLRPFLLTETAKMFGVKHDNALRAASAVECIHSYSLVHDDLPAMDNSDLRRGNPTTHKKYGEATAILAGDGLLTYAFEILADNRTHEDAAVRCKLVSALAKASGMQGMVGGQMLDLIAETAAFDIGEVTRLQRMKTGELIAVSIEMGAILGQAANQDITALRNYAQGIGLVFQIVDDLLDYESTEEEMGKPVGRDEEAGKATFVTIMGIERAKEQATILTEQTIGHLSVFGEKGKTLEEIARYILERKN